LAAVLIAAAAACLVSALIVDGRAGTFERRLLWMVAGITGIFLAGLYDDYRPARTRGVARQLLLLAKGHVTSGIVKLAVIVAASAFVAWMVGVRGARFALAVPVVAASANLWNLLDVVPGRSIKWFLVGGVILVFAVDVPEYRLLAATALGGAIALLAFDLREAAMLGDSGSNVLGFVVGLGLVGSLSVVGLAVALVVLLLLHGLAETVTLSRIIRAATPLRWFDHLGRARVQLSGSEDGRHFSVG
jgi:UDP-GlcNAc:undecaprenyl-phosphate/decaprenyl-phosphate GlcNAc-1-phosphate transferase